MLRRILEEDFLLVGHLVTYLYLKYQNSIFLYLDLESEIIIMFSYYLMENIIILGSIPRFDKEVVPYYMGLKQNWLYEDVPLRSPQFNPSKKIGLLLCDIVSGYRRPNQRSV